MKTVFIFLTLCLTQFVHGIKITHGPYICDMDSTTATILWITDKPGISWVEIAEEADDHFYTKERIRIYDVKRGRRQVNDTVHRVRIKGLKPDTKYRYRIFSKELTEWRNHDWVTYGRTASSVVYRREPYRFKTFPTQARNLSFLVLNDIHERAEYLEELCRGIEPDKLDFVVLNGDMSHSVENQEHIFKAYMDTCVSLFAKSTPVFLNRGNHETRGKFADKLWDYFPTQTDEFYHLKHIAGVDFLFLDSGEDKPDSDTEYNETKAFDEYREHEAEWLKALKDDNAVGQHPLIVFCHIPPTLGTWHGYHHIEQQFLPTLNRMNVTAMLSGHLHRHVHQEANEKVKFPILVNSHLSYLLCRVADGHLEIECSEPGGKNRKHFSFPLK